MRATLLDLLVDLLLALRASYQKETFKRYDQQANATRKKEMLYIAVVRIVIDQLLYLYSRL